MAYSFWKSSHFEQWTMEKADLLRGRAEDLKTYSEEEYQKIIIFFCNMMQSIAQDTSASNNATKIRMQVVATSSLYFKRFYIRRSFKDVDPFLMAPTCLMLAAKVEEFGALSTNKMSNAVNTYVKKMGLLVDLSPLRVGSLLEAEFILIEILDCCLICFQPYRPLKQLFQDLRELPSQYKDLETLEASAVKIINDSIRTDLSIIYPPHVIAIGAFQLAVIMHNREKDFLNWFADLQVEMDKILDVVQTMTNLYKVWKTAEDKETMKALFDRMPKATFQSDGVQLLEEFPLTTPATAFLEPTRLERTDSKSSNQWTMEKADLLRGRAEDLKMYSEEEYQKIIIFFCNMMQSIAQDPNVLSDGTKIRMQVVATASLYFKRFYIRRSFKDVEPLLMAPTCLMLAAKVEEFGPLSTKNMAIALNNYVIKTGLPDGPARVGSFFEAEFILIEILDCCLICFQPYRPLKQLFQDLREHRSQFKDLETLDATAVKIINDSIRTDLSFIYPPHVIAIGAFQLAVIHHNREKDFLNWFADQPVEPDKVLDVVQTMTNLYEVWKTAEDYETMKALFDRMPKPNPNPPTQQQQQQQQQQCLSQQQQMYMQHQQQQQMYMQQQQRRMGGY